MNRCFVVFLFFYCLDVNSLWILWIWFYLVVLLFYDWNLNFVKSVFFIVIINVFLIRWKKYFLWNLGFGYEVVKWLDKIGFMVFVGCLYLDGEGVKVLWDICLEYFYIVKFDVIKVDDIEKVCEYVEKVY